ncbi:MAG: DUF3500 domain-containing protein [Pseudomonadales bacterium]
MSHRMLFCALLVTGISCWSLELTAAEPAADAPRPIPTPEVYADRSKRFSAHLEKDLANEFVGVTSDGEPEPGLFEILSTGVSTQPMVNAAQAFLAALSPEQRAETQYAVDDIEWRKWANQHIYHREGVSFEDMDDTQRVAAFALLEASLSAKGLKLSRDIMRLNETLAELNNNNFVDYGEWKYHLTVMGEPDPEQPWGWQLDGHHLIVNFFVLGDQVVMTPSFWGSEPAVAHGGKYKGTRIMDAEQAAGLAMIRALDQKQQGQAVLAPEKPGNNILAEAFSDNLVLDFAGVSVATFSEAQRARLMELVMLYVGNLRDGHAQIHRQEIEAHLDDTFFAWIGGMADDSVFYYRIHSPVILIEFDHELPVGLRHLYPNAPNREHIHAVVRTPNGNDYGKDLLRQHYAEHPH